MARRSQNHESAVIGAELDGEGGECFSLDLHVCSNDDGVGAEETAGHLHERHDGESLERSGFLSPSFLLCFAVLEHGPNHVYGPGLRTLLCLFAMYHPMPNA